MRINLNALLKLPLPLVLASQSPRRSALLNHVGFTFTTVVPNIDEDAVDTALPPHEYVSELAHRKAIQGASLCTEPSIVVGSDTTVVLDGTVLNKPTGPLDAHRMLRLLSGRTHTVYTGVSLATSGTERYVLSQWRATQVSFRELTDEEITAYISAGSPLDKAGAYGIQDDFGATFVRHIEGCYYTIVGLPLELLHTMLQEFVRTFPGE